MLDSQYENGGWPQRFPRVEGEADYIRQITFNDDVAGENIKFLLMAYQTLGDERALPAIRRAMEIFIATQQRAPQAGWGLQHDVQTLAPVGARTYEPEALTTHTTATNIGAADELLRMDWRGALHRARAGGAGLARTRCVCRIRRCACRAATIRPSSSCARTARASSIAAARTSSAASTTGTTTPAKPITHYSQWRNLDVAALRARYERLRAASPQQLAAASPFSRRADFRLPRFFTTQNIEVSDMTSNVGAGAVARPTPERARELIATLNADGYWPTPLAATSQPYAGERPAAPAPGDFSQTLVGDRYDTSPYIAPEPRHRDFNRRFHPEHEFAFAHRRFRRMRASVDLSPGRGLSSAVVRGDLSRG